MAAGFLSKKRAQVERLAACLALLDHGILVSAGVRPAPQGADPQDPFWLVDWQHLQGAMSMAEAGTGFKLRIHNRLHGGGPAALTAGDGDEGEQPLALAFNKLIR